MKLVSPSILAANFNMLGNAIEMLNLSEADYVHCDVMDGVFVPNISFGIPVVKAVSEISRKPLDVHRAPKNGTRRRGPHCTCDAPAPTNHSVTPCTANGRRVSSYRSCATHPGWHAGWLTTFLAASADFGRLRPQ